MSRIRSVHPGLWTDVEFVSLSAFARLMFIGIWNECDDQGVFVWSALQLKMRLMPADNVDAAALLAEMADVNAVRRFDVDGKAFGVVRNFLKFQRPKKPNKVHPCTTQMTDFAGGTAGSAPEPDDDGGEPAIDEETLVPNQFPTDGEITPQMEEGGGRMEEVREPSGSLPPVAPQAEIGLPVKAKKPKVKAASPALVPMTADWKPGPLPENVADLVAQWPPGRLEREADQTRDFWLDRPNEKRPGWDRTFHNRIRDVHPKVMREASYDRSQANGRPAAGNYGRGGDGFDRACADELREIDRSERAAEATGRPATRDGPAHRQLAGPS